MSEILTRDLYVDNIITSLSSESDVLTFLQDTLCMKEEAGFTAAGVVPCGGRKTSPRTSTIVQFIFYFGPLRSAIIF